MEKVIVIAASGHAKVVIDILKLSNFNVIGILDDNQSIHGQKISGVEVLGSFDDDNLSKILESGVYNAFVAIGNSAVRVKFGEKLTDAGFKLIKAIHPRSIIADSVTIGDGSMVAAGAIINPFATIGDHVIINTGATVDHDCQLANGVHISPGANLAGNVKVGEQTHIGIGSCIIQGVEVAENCIIGAGSVVVRNIEKNVTAYGVPARVKENYTVTKLHPAVR